MSTREDREKWKRLADAASQEDPHDNTNSAQWDAVKALDDQWHEIIPALLADVERLEAERDAAQAASSGLKTSWALAVRDRDANLAEIERLRAWVARAVGALTLALKAYVGGASCRACGAPTDAHYSMCPTNALRAVLADAPKETP